MRDWFISHRWRALPALVIAGAGILRSLYEHAGGDEDVAALLIYGSIAVVATVWTVWGSVLARRHGPAPRDARHASARTKYF